MLITGNVPASIQQVISQLNSHFSLKDLGEVSLFLGVEVVKTTDNGLRLSQSNYIKDLLKRASITEAKGCPTPMVTNCELSKYTSDPISDPKLYRSVVGALQYTTITRPDINFAVNKVIQYMESPLDTHWRAVKRILRYLSGTLDYEIQLHISNGDISAFSDSDWAADVDDRRSTTGVHAYHGRNLISWCVKKQTVVERSSTEAEYRSLAQAASEVAWLTSLLNELRIKKRDAPVIWVDNLSAIALASNPVLHARTKHIELDMHFVRDKVLNNELELRHVPTKDQIADIFTKPLSHQSFVKLRERLGLVSLASLGLRGRVRSGCRNDQVKISLINQADDLIKSWVIKRDDLIKSWVIKRDDLIKPVIKRDDLIKRVEGDVLINQVLLFEKSGDVHTRGKASENSQQDISHEPTPHELSS
ncbi:uncharacterized mitochondrial protein AtMg00810-like [Salvia splendens]|uniref:uncharacterized mitochondrial protein AtMg00810-like n=1 Tax=Salvia splendens TaxID=180675 RepID=UPI001C260A7D|nr:uncharacterized mitochondrial protein AtMg00810-like [Salvia splendens]